MLAKLSTLLVLLTPLALVACGDDDKSNTEVDAGGKAPAADGGSEPDPTAKDGGPTDETPDATAPDSGTPVVDDADAAVVDGSAPVVEPADAATDGDAAMVAADAGDAG